jgi:uncharacterized protein YdhG (YjbR/CyaY superfamily)
MERKKVRFASIDDYIATFPAEVQAMLVAIRASVKAAAPEAEEKIAYHMPTFALEGNMVCFAAFKKHIGFFGVPTDNLALNKKLAPYANDKGSLKFPIGKPLPLDLITKVIKLRVKENLKNAKIKSPKKK